jgi:PA14 domain
LGDFREHIADGELLGQTPWGGLFKDWGANDKDGPTELGGMTGNFSARFRSKRKLELGTYLFKILADDRSRLKINGKEIISAWRTGSFEQTAAYSSNGGWVDIEIEYMNDSFNAYLKLDWRKIS